MPSYNIDGHKSTVRVHESTKRVTKRALPSQQSLFANSLILTESSSPESPHQRYRVEAGMLGVLTRIPDAERCTPYLHQHDDDTLTMEMELLPAPTRRDKLVQFRTNENSLWNIVSTMAQDVARLHCQFDQYQRELLEATREDARIDAPYGLRVRGKKEIEERVWSYVRTALVALSPDLQDLQRDLRRNSREVKAAVRAKYPDLKSENAQNELQQEAVRITDQADNEVKNHLDSKGINPDMFVNKYASRYCWIMYRCEDPEEKTQELLGKRLLRIIHGDLGPHHLRVRRRVHDLDEARLGPTVVDVSAALYNIFTYPSNAAEETRLLRASFGYLKGVHKKEKVGKRKKAEFTARLVTARLDEMVRLLGVDCRVPVSSLRRFTMGHSDYDSLSDSELRQDFLRNMFLNRLPPFIDFWTQGDGWAFLNRRKILVGDSTGSTLPDLVHEQLLDVHHLFSRTKMYDGLRDEKVLRSLVDMLEE